MRRFALKWNQVGLSRWEEAPGDKAAVALFSSRAVDPPFSSLDFEYPADEDSVGFAVVVLPAGDVVAFVDIMGNPVPGTFLWRAGDADADSLISEACLVAGLTASDVKWRHGMPIPYGA